MRLGIVVVGLAVLLAGCRKVPTPSTDSAGGFGAKPARLDGTYGVRTGGIVEPVLKVELTKTGYAFEERETDEWRADAETPHVATEAEVKRALAMARVDVPVYGLATGTALLVKVPPGWHGVGPGTAGREIVTKTGFLLSGKGGLVPVEKVELGSR